MALNRLEAVANRLAAVEEEAVAWRTQYDTDLNDLTQQRRHVRTLVAAMRSEAELQEGRRRLRLAVEFKARQTAQGEEAARLALLLTDHIGKKAAVSLTSGRIWRIWLGLLNSLTQKTTSMTSLT